MTLDPEPGTDDRTESVRIGVCITPYARQRYAFFTRHLAPITTQHVGRVEGDVLHVDTALKDASGSAFQVHLGLQDCRVTYRIENGNLVRTDSAAGRAFSYTSQYVAVTPSGTAGLKLVQQFVSDLQHGPGGASATDQTVQAASFVHFFASLFGSGAGRLLTLLYAVDVTATQGAWTVYSNNIDVRKNVLPRLRLIGDAQRAQIRFAVPDPNQAQAADYLHAFAYVESRKASAQVAQLLNELSTQLNVDPQLAPLAVERIFEAKPVCPLQGDFQLQETDGRKYWTSTAWNEASCYEMQQVPRDYRFPFLDWMRGATVDFALAGTTLHADVRLDVKPANGPSRSLRDNAPVMAGRESADGKNAEVTTVKTPPSDDQPFAAGDQVVVTAERGRLLVGTEQRLTFPRHAQLVVIEVRGNWIGVWGFQQGKAVRGWMHRQDLARR